MLRKQLAIHEAYNLLGRSPSDPLPELIDHGAGRLSADPERNPGVASSGRQRRRDKHDGVVSEPIERPSRRHDGREMPNSPDRAAK
jgi:hypothetical protein